MTGLKTKMSQSLCENIELFLTTVNILRNFFRSENRRSEDREMIVRSKVAFVPDMVAMDYGAALAVKLQFAFGKKNKIRP